LDEGMSVKPGAAFIMPMVSWLNDGSDAPAERFAVTEADLMRLERAQDGMKPPAPPKTALELMQEAAARVEGKVEAKPPEQTTAPTAQITAPTAATTLVETAPVNADQPGHPTGDSTQAQRDRIQELYKLLSLTPEQQAAILAKRGLSVLRSLSSEQAATIIQGLEGKLPAIAQPAQAPTPASTTLADQPPGKSLTGVHRQNLSGPSTDDQVQAIKAALIEWEQTEAGITEKFLAALSAAGFNKIADLSAEQAARELAGLHQRNMQDFFAASAASSRVE
jgi:hypothetical protein